jgi:phosphoglycolate phosphatase
MSLQAVIFDLDGTLVDTPKVIVATALEALRGRPLAMPEPQSIRATIGLPLTVAFSGLLGLPEGSPEVEEVVQEYRRLWRANVVPRSSDLLYPGVGEGVQLLRDLGLRLAVATSKVRSGALAQLEAAGIAEHFQVVAGFDSVERPKPDPQMARYVLGQLGAEPEAAVVVGDTTHDLLMAHGAGLRAIAVTYGAHDEATLRTESPDWLAGDFPEVVRLLRQLAKR